MDKENRKRNKAIYFIGIVIFLAIHYSLNNEIFSPIKDYVPFLQNLTSSLAIVSIILLIRSVLDRLIDRMDQSVGEQYNLRRIIRFVSSIVIVLVLISLIFQKPYTTLAGLGLISLVLSFALQVPITSFIAWLYIIFRRPFHVGDRIQIGTHRGDVLEISYLDTKVRECKGDYLGNDRISGRIIHFPNSLIWTEKVVNYSGDFVPFIWDETALQIAYTSDLNLIESCLKEVTILDFKEQYPDRSIEEEDEPGVYFRVNERAWLEAVISYPVEPSDTTGRRNRILKKALPLLNLQADKVKFPQGTQR